MAFVDSSSHSSRWTKINFKLWLDVHILLSNYPTRLIAEQQEWPVLVWPSAHAPDEGRNHRTLSWVTNFPRMEKVISSPVSLLFCCFTFGPLTSNALQQLLFFRLLLAVSIPCKSLSHQGLDGCSTRHGCTGSNWEMGFVCEVETNDILCFAQSLFFFWLYFAECWCVYLSAIPTCGDAACGNHLSRWFLQQTLTCTCLPCFISLMGLYKLIKIL